MNNSKTIPFFLAFKIIAIALFTGFAIGWIRYWVGYYILLQGVLVGLLIPWLVNKISKSHQKNLSTIRFKIALLLFFFFMIGQAIGFGWAQPVFDPFNWFARVWNGDTVESVFGIFSTAGVVHQAFAKGLNGGFWLLLTIIDLFFMFFFILISMPLNFKKSQS